METSKKLEEKHSTHYSIDTKQALESSKFQAIQGKGFIMDTQSTNKTDTRKGFIMDPQSSNMACVAETKRKESNKHHLCNAAVFR